jgi:peptide deformylase
MRRKILQIGDKTLLTKSSPLTKKEIVSREIQELIDDLIDTCNYNKEGSAGLSAVQIGIPLNIFIGRRVDLEEDEEVDPIWETFINPKIKTIGARKSRMWEGCLSIGVGKNRLFAPISRAGDVSITYTNREGKEQELEASDYMAHILQHEYDHLQGKLFLSYVSNPANIWKSGDLDEYLDENGNYPPSA